MADSRSVGTGNLVRCAGVPALLAEKTLNGISARQDAGVLPLNGGGPICADLLGEGSAARTCVNQSFVRQRHLARKP